MLLGTYGPRVSEASQEQEIHLRHKEREERLGKVGRGAWKRDGEMGVRVEILAGFSAERQRERKGEVFHGVMKSRNHGIMESRNHGVME